MSGHCLNSKRGCSCIFEWSVIEQCLRGDWTLIVFKHVQRYVFSFFTFRRRHCRSFSGDLPDKPFLRLRLDAAGRIARNPEHPEVTGTSGYRIGIYRTSGKKFSPFKLRLKSLFWSQVHRHVPPQSVFALVHWRGDGALAGFLFPASDWAAPELDVQFEMVVPPYTLAFYRSRTLSTARQKILSVKMHNLADSSECNMYFDLLTGFFWRILCTHFCSIILVMKCETCNRSQDWMKRGGTWMYLPSPQECIWHLRKKGIEELDFYEREG